MKRSRPWILPSFLATALYIAFIGMCQFAFSAVHEPVLCQPISSPWVRLCYWFKSGRKELLADYFNHREVRRLVAMSVIILLLAGAFVWSIHALRVCRFCFRLRTLMIAIAVLSCAWTIEKKVWFLWGQMDDYAMMADYYSSMEKMSSEIDPSEDPLAIKLDREMALKYQAAKEHYRHAMWHPWLEVKPDVSYPEWLIREVYGEDGISSSASP